MPKQPRQCILEPMRDKSAFVSFPPNLTPVRVVKRRNRFVVEAVLDTGDDPVSAGDSRVDRPKGVRERRSAQQPTIGKRRDGELLVLHLPNSGRMKELLVRDAPALASLDGSPGRKTDGTLLLVRYNGRWVSVDARMPNQLFERCLEERCLPPFDGYDRWRAEASWGKGRIDFLLTAGDGSRPPLLVETKSCNLVEDGLALFPDAPTERGARHVRELAAAVRDGYRAAVVWFVQRDDATRLAPYRDADPAFADAVADARAAGVELYAYRCRVTPAGIEVLDEIPVVDA